MAQRRNVRILIGFCLAGLLLSVVLTSSHARQLSASPRVSPIKPMPSMDEATFSNLQQQHITEAQQTGVQRALSVPFAPRSGESLETYLATALPAAAAQPRGYFNVDPTTPDDEFSPDANPGDGVCQDNAGMCGLRAAIMEANASSNLDHIILPAGTWNMALSGSSEDNALTGDLDITKPVIIQGAGAGLTILDASFVDRAFDVYSAADFHDLTIKNGTVAGSGGAVRAACGAELLMRDVMIATSNAGFGGALEVAGCGTPDSTHAYIYDSTISGNAATGGGALDGISGGSTVLSNVTISQNSASIGGALLFTGSNSLAASAVTIADNHTGTESSGALVPGAGGAIINLSGSIVAYNFSGVSTPRNCSGTIISGGYNVYTDNTCQTTGTDLVDGMLPLSPLEINAPGDTLTYSLPIGASAIDRIPEGNQCPVKDQRGVNRPQNGLCDSGAYERDDFEPTDMSTGVILETATATETATNTTVPVETATETETAVATIDATVTETATDTIPVETATETETPSGQTPAEVTVTSEVPTATETGIGSETQTPTETATETATQAVTETATPSATVTLTAGTELIENGGFEAGTIDPWVEKHAKGDKIKCDEPDKPVAYAGDCAYRFKGSTGENSSLVQIVDLTGITFTADDQLALDLYLNAGNNATSGKVKLRVLYGDETPVGKLNVDLVKTDGYTLLDGTLNIDSASVTKIRLIIQNRSSKSKLFVDEVSLKLNTDAGGAILLPLPGN